MFELFLCVVALIQGSLFAQPAASHLSAAPGLVGLVSYRSPLCPVCCLCCLFLLQEGGTFPLSPLPLPISLPTVLSLSLFRDRASLALFSCCFSLRPFPTSYTFLFSLLFSFLLTIITVSCFSPLMLFIVCLFDQNVCSTQDRGLCLSVHLMLPSG